MSAETTVPGASPAADLHERHRYGDIEVNITAATTLATTAAKAVKQTCVAQGETMACFILAWRGHDPIGLVAVTGRRREYLAAAELFIDSLGADLLAMTADSRMVRTPTNPDTGQTLRPGEISAYARAHSDKEGEVFTEVLATIVVNRAGDQGHAMNAYRVTPSPFRAGHHHLTWLDWAPDEAAPSGAIPDALAAAMGRPSLDVRYVHAGGDLDEIEQWRDEADIATLAAMHQRLGSAARMMLFAEPGTPRDQLLRSRLNPEQIRWPRDLGL